MEPSIIPTGTPDCEIEVSIDCVDSNGTKCEDIEPPRDKCDEQPSVLVLRYNGGDCTQDDNEQPPAENMCFDFSGGPSRTAPAYVRAFDSMGQGEEYFSGPLEIGEEFTLGTPENPLRSETSFVISEGIEAGGTPLQVINFQTSCEGNLFLKDRFGSTEVVGWTNQAQGTVSCQKLVSFNYFIMNTGVVETEPTSLVGTINGIDTDLSNQLPDSLAPKENFTATLPYDMNFATRIEYVATASVTGLNPGGKECTDSDELVFEAGSGELVNSPTASPTASPAPTSDAMNISCTLSSAVSCRGFNNIPCSSFSAVPSEDLTCDLNDPTQFSWFYRATNCAESTTTQAIQCMDMSGGPASEPGAVFVRAVGVSSMTTYFSGSVVQGNLVTMQNLAGSNNFIPLDSMISISITRGGPLGEPLQIMIFDTACDTADDLTLGKLFGALELAVYRNDEVVVRGFEFVNWRFEVTNVGSTLAELTNSTADVNGEVIDSIPLDPDNPVRLSPGVTTESVTMYVASTVAPITYTSTLIVTGEAVGGLGCQTTASSSFSL